MSGDNWLEATRVEEQRLLDEITKTTLYKQLAAVRAVIAVYEDTSGSSVTPVPTGAPVPSARTNGSASRHSFKSANAFSDTPVAAGDASSRANPQ
jgi:hypothetical protein